MLVHICEEYSTTANENCMFERRERTDNTCKFSIHARTAHVPLFTRFAIMNKFWSDEEERRRRRSSPSAVLL